MRTFLNALTYTSRIALPIAVVMVAFAIPSLAKAECPSDAELMAVKIYHHMDYMVTTAKQAGGTNKLLHTKKLPTEGADSVVTPALDHIYTKGVVDLTDGPVIPACAKSDSRRGFPNHVNCESVWRT